MSDVAQGPGWWMASDGKWYPPELHPSVRNPQQVPVAVGAAAVPGGGMGGRPPAGAAVGPQFPDLYEAAKAGNSKADAVRVVYDGDDVRRTIPSGPTLSVRGHGDSFVANGKGGAKRKRRRSK